MLYESKVKRLDNLLITIDINMFELPEIISISKPSYFKSMTCNSIRINDTIKMSTKRYTRLFQLA